MVNELLKVLKLLIENGGEKLSIRKISKLRRINYKTAYNAVMKLNEQSVVSLEKLGNTTNCYFSHKFNPLVLMAEYERRGELMKNKNIKILHEKLNSMPFPLIALIFGSYVKRGAEKGSDIDLLVVCEDERVAEVESGISLLPLKIHLTAITPEEFIKMLKSREFSVVSEAIKRNIILVGVEDYYRLVEYAG